MKDLGAKHVCFKCGTKFYDLKKPAPICPKCGADQRDQPPPSKSERKKAPPPPATRLEAVEETDEDATKDEDAEDEEAEAEEEDV
jgi:uncharacterized protein (TIGR02300 family)